MAIPEADSEGWRGPTRHPLVSQHPGWPPPEYNSLKSRHLDEILYPPLSNTKQL